jgi:methylglutaconyl-CoA hydratase
MTEVFIDKAFSRIIVEPGIITTLWLNRPEVHNAMDATLIAELTEAVKLVEQVKDARIVVLRGKGKSFCAGADLNYMKSIASFGFEENVEDGKKLARLFKTIHDCQLPTIAVVHGAAYGGANGLLAACDIVVAETNTTFAFSEVKLGIAPATIAPFVIKRIGEFGARELMLTGKRFKSGEAVRWNLVNHAAEEEELDETLHKLTRQLLSSAPNALKETKALISKVVSTEAIDQDLINYTTEKIAELRASDEGQEGMAAFLEKRKAGWVEEA